MITGRCDCGAVQFQVNGPIHDYSHCHCSICRRTHGAAFASFGGVAKSDFSFIGGENDVKAYVSAPGSKRNFCKHCGSNILAELEIDPDNYYLSMGAVDGNPDLPPEYHIFVGSKAPWYHFESDSPQYDGDLLD